MKASSKKRISSEYPATRSPVSRVAASAARCASMATRFGLEGRGAEGRGAAAEVGMCRAQGESRGAWHLPARSRFAWGHAHQRLASKPRRNTSLRLTTAQPLRGIDRQRLKQTDDLHSGEPR